MKYKLNDSGVLVPDRQVLTMVKDSNGVLVHASDQRESVKDSSIIDGNQGYKYYDSRLRISVPKGDRATFMNNGIMKVPAFLTRSGQFEYRMMDGTIIVENRPDVEVFNPSSMQSAGGVPVTVDHPPELLPDLNQVNKEMVGMVGENLFQEGDLLGANLYIFNPNVIDMILLGKLIEISMGYFAKIREYMGNLPGVKTEQYDIQYNHAALLPEGAGRAGDRVSVKLDSKGQAYYMDSYTTKLLTSHVKI